jgi:hypothetical protein
MVDVAQRDKVWRDNHKAMVHTRKIEQYYIIYIYVFIDTYFRRFCSDGQMNFSIKFWIVVWCWWCFLILSKQKKKKKNKTHIFSPFFLLFRLPMHSLYSNTDTYTHVNDEKKRKMVKASRANRFFFSHFSILCVSITCQKQYVRASIIFLALLDTSFSFKF